MRRGIAASALVASLALTATACGGSDSDSKSDGPVTITWWDTSNATNESPTYKALVKEFEAANKDIKVNYVDVQFDQAQNKFDTAAQSGKGAPDVLRSEVGWTPPSPRPATSCRWTAPPPSPTRTSSSPA